MAQSGWRLPDDLLRRVRVRCAESGERQNVFVERALETALANLAVAGESKAEGATGRSGSPAPSRASKSTAAELKGLQNFAEQAVVDQREAAMDRQRRLNERKAK